MSEPQTRTKYYYDIMGNLTQLTKTINGQTYMLAYNYNFAGELATLIYTSGRVLQQNYDTVGRLCGVGALGTSCTSVSAYTSGVSYNAAGQVTALTYGNGVAASMGYTPDRLQLQSLSYSKGSSTLFSTSYSYRTDSTNCPLAPAGNNGQIQCITDNTPTNSDNGRSIAYGYDPLYRLTSAITAGSATYPQWGLSWTYDRYGNRTNQNVTAGTAPSNQLSFSTTGGALTNHPDNFPFDANGNMTNDGTNTLTYDAENHLVSSSGTLGSGSYSYDGNGLRVQRVSGGTTTVYIFSGGRVLAEYTNGGVAPSVEYVYSGSQMTASIASTSYNGSAASGTAEVGGSEQVIPGRSATPGTGTVAINGNEQSAIVNMCPNSPPYNCPQTVYDSGTVTVTVNGFHASTGYGSGSTANSLALGVASSLNASGSPVTATANGSTVTLVAKTTGTGSNYSVSTSVSYSSNYFSYPSFTASGSNLTGGAAGVATVYDTGTTWVTVNGFQALWTYGQNDTPTTVAVSIANIFNTNNSSPVTAVATNGSLTLTSKTPGSGGNYPLSGGCSTSQPSTFSHASFCVSESGTTLGWTAATYYQGDHLSVRLITDTNGNVIGERGNYPYGETWYEPNATTKWKFTTYERDPESGNDYAGARTYINRLGRFSSPDPLLGAPGNPQSLNRYAYAANDPINLTDPSGQYWMGEDGDYWDMGSGWGGDMMGGDITQGLGDPGSSNSCFVNPLNCSVEVHATIDYMEPSSYDPYSIDGQIAFGVAALASSCKPGGGNNVGPGQGVEKSRLILLKPDCINFIENLVFAAAAPLESAGNGFPDSLRESEQAPTMMMQTLQETTYQTGPEPKVPGYVIYASTTPGSRTVTLYKPYSNLSPLAQGQNLVHEAIHDAFGYTDQQLANVLTGKTYADTPAGTAAASDDLNAVLKQHCN